MGSFITKQPNGLYCRFSSVVDCPTHWNMPAEVYIEYCAEKAREEAREVLEKHVRPFDDIIQHFIPDNMSEKDFKKFLAEVGYRPEPTVEPHNNFKACLVPTRFAKRDCPGCHQYQACVFSGKENYSKYKL